ncbi:MAG TPA: sulfite oxidase [Chloroflexota bacterium]
MSQPRGRLAVLSQDPFNAETVLAEHHGLITPNHSFYKRNHFHVPEIDASSWTVTIEGAVDQPQVLSLDDLLSLPRRSLTVTMECAGNGRSSFQPAVAGEPWEYGAASTAEWTGAQLRDVIEEAGLRDVAQEVIVEGADGGHVADAGGSVTYVRSVPIETALHPDTLLAYTMNGEPLPVEHGFPVRLLVPGWYGMASVKWVTRIAAVSEPYRGFYQWDRYVMLDPADETRRSPLREMRIRSLFTAPVHGALLWSDRHHLRGFAWSGSDPVERVEVSTDGGASWEAARFTSASQPYAWRGWEAPWEPAQPGTYTLQCRAFDAAGASQPAEPEWNRLGYANNAIHSVQVHVGNAPAQTRT